MNEASSSSHTVICGLNMQHRSAFNVLHYRYEHHLLCSCFNSAKSWCVVLQRLRVKQLGKELLLHLSSKQPPLISSLSTWHLHPWQQGQRYLLTCQALIDRHSSLSSEKFFLCWQCIEPSRWSVCQPWSERRGVTLSPLQGCTQHFWQDVTKVGWTSGYNTLSKCTWNSHRA